MNMTVAMRWTVWPMLWLLCGCTALLPRGETEAPSRFVDFAAASGAFDRIVAYRSTLADLETLGFDVHELANVRAVPYPQLVALVVPSPMLAAEGLDPGIRDCIAAREACTAYQFDFGRVKRERRGRFATDFFNFERETHTTGWRFEGLVLVREGTVLFRSHGGERRIEQVERKVNPLGPLQGLGDAIQPSLP